ncbi:MAG: LPS export ABC transporter permease LptF [Gammaproteobacteria bacterium]|nr:LPS export ABC transporter permease LptF [Gammaproteobacteria bacterium]MYH45226.1 LPS export ABC transporter permease LptF [Gammaproteobacteria bacterium]MYL12464.1 LPS export ABC transporter permease LptF [Gammaproteobacteria bacterium]
MIVFRYLARQVLQATAVVALILLAVAVISRFMQYLGEAASGQKAADALFLIMLYRLPEFLLVILPLALLLGIVLSYGRMYAENEMVSLMGAGIGQTRLTRITLGIAAVAMALMGVLSLGAAPWGMRHAEAIVQGQEELTEIDLIVAGQFRSFSDGGRVTWTERTSNADNGGRELRNVFVAVSGEGAESGAAPMIVFAESARPMIDEATGARFMRMENVAQYDGVPGSAEFSVGRFDAQSILLPQPAEFEETLEQSTIATLDLIGSADPVHAGELHWRLSLIMLAPVLGVLAVPMSRVQPRQGRYIKLVPAAFLYVVYFALLEFCRDAVRDGGSPYAFWLVHAVFLALGLAAIRQGRMSRRLSWKPGT